MVKGLHRAYAESQELEDKNNRSMADLEQSLLVVAEEQVPVAAGLGRQLEVGTHYLFISTVKVTLPGFFQEKKTSRSSIAAWASMSSRKLRWISWCWSLIRSEASE